MNARVKCEPGHAVSRSVVAYYKMSTYKELLIFDSKMWTVTLSFALQPKEQKIVLSYN